MKMQQTVQARQVAYIVSIKDLVNGVFVKEDGWTPNYVNIADKHVSRVNIIGAVISVVEDEAMQNTVIDDGTGKISVKNFENKISVAIGDIVLVVGRVRSYGNEIYLTPEIIKKSIHTKWNLVWKRLALKKESSKEYKNIIVEETVAETQDSRNRVKEILQKIRDLDDGNGADYEELLKLFSNNSISDLLTQGEIFEIKPGKIKVLD